MFHNLSIGIKRKATPSFHSRDVPSNSQGRNPAQNFIRNGRRLSFPDFFSDKKAHNFARLFQQTTRVLIFLSLFILPHITTTSLQVVLPLSNSVRDLT